MLRTALSVLLACACAATFPLAVPADAHAHPSDSAFDSDHDGVNDPPFGADNCAGDNGAFNPLQKDIDSDGLGDECDTDDDADSVDDAIDNCPVQPNQAQADLDGDSVGDACDFDDDGDGRADSRDNCRFVPNPGQADADNDGLGDACEKSAPGAKDPPDATGAAGPPDGTPPTIAVALTRRHRTAELLAGLAVPVTCSERCTLSSTLTLTARDARRLGLERVLGTGGAELDAAGATFVFVDLPRRALRRVRGAVPVMLRIEVADPAGNRRATTRRLTIRS